MSKYYSLTKLSSPNSFVIHSGSLHPIVGILFDYTCQTCLNGNEDIQDAEGLEVFNPEDSLEDQLDFLMGSACGAEFMFEEFESFEDYMKDLIDTYKDGTV